MKIFKYIKNLIKKTSYRLLKEAYGSSMPLEFSYKDKELDSENDDEPPTIKDAMEKEVGSVADELPIAIVIQGKMGNSKEWLNVLRNLPGVGLGHKAWIALNKDALEVLEVAEDRSDIDIKL